jgi:hypothetical protein
MIQTRVAQAAAMAADQEFTVRIKGSVLDIFDKHSTATLLFRSDHIVFQRLGVDLRQRRRHLGSAILRLVIAIANQAGLRLELIVEPPLRPHKADLSQSDLHAWYRRYKFEATDEVLMSRLPEGDGTPGSLTAA